jgi:outer membrane protein assembly factor BamB
MFESMRTPASLLPLALSIATGSLCAEEWPQYRGPQTNGTTQEKIAPAWGPGGPKQLWKVPSDGGFSSFAVGGGRVFTLALKESEGAKQESIIALDSATGKELWFSPLNFPKYDGGGDAGTDSNKGGDGPRSTPTVSGDRVYALSSQLALNCYETATGKVIWTRDLLKEHSGRNIQWQNAASPLLEQGMLFVAGGGPGESLLAIDAKTGAVVWKAFDEKMTHATPVVATILGERQVIFFLQSGLLAVEPNTGRELWRYGFDYKISTAASPVVEGDVVYCSAGYGVGAGAVRINRKGDRFEAVEIYRARGNKPLANHWSTPVAAGGHLYGMFQFKEYGQGPLKCVEMATGNVKWEQPGFGPGHVILASNKVLALSDAGDLVLIDAVATGYKELARAHVLEGKCWTTPVVAGGKIYARSTREAVCLEAPAP